MTWQEQAALDNLRYDTLQDIHNFVATLHAYPNFWTWALIGFIGFIALALRSA